MSSILEPTREVVTSDQKERLRALDPDASFIVQAPAGSGKTGLLVQRLLVLLARVNVPEEIVAITFTRKAASEMRLRVVEALEGAAGSAPPEEPHARRTWELARAALARDAKLQWNLKQQPFRLRIQTIDSLCSNISRQMPQLSGFGGSPELATNPEELYREAARRTIELVDDDQSGWSDALAALLLHLDNRYDLAEGLLINMLRAREQWLRHALPTEKGARLRAILEKALESIVSLGLKQLTDRFPKRCAETLARLACFAAGNFEIRDSIICRCAGLKKIPGALPADLGIWEALAELLLTKNGQWRRTVNKRQGFPASSSAENPTQGERLRSAKKDMAALIEDLSECPGLNDCLHELRMLPLCSYADAQWQILESILLVLHLAVAQLRVIFAARQQVDFPEISMAALDALGEEANPTDLALAMDSRIQHLLVDEFQDTSYGQYRLLEKLTAGWEAGDGRTLFLVGDPMQSIYRFREAEVGLFLRTFDSRKLGDVAVEPLRLRSNFRSRPELVEWVNAAFTEVFPREGDPISGAVPYIASSAVRGAAGRAGVRVYPVQRNGSAGGLLRVGTPAIPGESQERASLTEADHVVSILREIAATDQGALARTAILVRAKTHMADVMPALQQAGIPYCAVEMDSLARRMVVSDLLSLTRALLHLADRIAWLALLRAPWCGLLLSDLHAIAGGAPGRTVWELMNDPDREMRLTPDGLARLARVRDVLDAGLKARGSVPRLRRWIEGVWLALGGPACAASEAELADAQEYFNLLDELDEGGMLSDIDNLTVRLSTLFAAPTFAAGDSLQVMTIHKAKGLEFDHVILPGLGRRTSRDSEKLLLWLELPELPGEAKLVLAPVGETGSDKDRIYQYLAHLDSRRTDHETSRLLYVAATRARETLHLLGSVLEKGPQVAADEVKASPDGRIDTPTDEPSSSEDPGGNDAAEEETSAPMEATVEDSGRTLGSPASGSLLRKLWPVVEPAFQQAFAARREPNSPSSSSASTSQFAGTLAERTAPSGSDASGAAPGAGVQAPQSGQINPDVTYALVRRLSSEWKMPNTPPETTWKPQLKTIEPAPEEMPASKTALPAPGDLTSAGFRARVVGTVTHRYLRLLGMRSIDAWTADRIATLGGRITAALAEAGVASADLDAACKQVQTALRNAITDPKARWILGQHAERNCEYELSGVAEGKVVNLRVDRTFVDSDGTRWVIDFKAATHEGAGLESFLDFQQRVYQGQLNRYAAFLTSLDPTDTRPIRVALYFPLLRAWREWEPQLE